MHRLLLFSHRIVCQIFFTYEFFFWLLLSCYLAPGQCSFDDKRRGVNIAWKSCQHIRATEMAGSSRLLPLHLLSAIRCGCDVCAVTALICDARTHVRAACAVHCTSLVHFRYNRRRREWVGLELGGLSIEGLFVDAQNIPGMHTLCMLYMGG